MNRDSTWFSYNTATQRLTLTLHVQPNARRNEITGLHGDALKVKIAAPATDNKANAALIAILGETLDITKSTITIRHGATRRRKVVEITGGPELVSKIANLK